MGLSLKRLGDGPPKDFAAVKAEQAERPGGHVADIASGLDPTREEQVDVGHLRAKAIAAFEVATSALSSEQLRAVGRVLDPLPPSPGAVVFCDHFEAIEQSDLRLISDDRQRGSGV